VERRTFLVLSAAAVGLAGCTSDPSEPGPPSAPATTAAPSDPDARIREDVAASEVALIAAYRSAIGANPDLAGDLAPFLTQHQAHLARVAPGLVADVGPPLASMSASGSPSGEPSAAGEPNAAASGSSEAGASPSGFPESGDSPSGSPESGDSPSGSPRASSSPSGSSDAGAASIVAELAAAESAAQAQRATACDGAQNPGLARDLCLIAASEAQHAAALGDLGEQRAWS
jgi:hypothetical protein